MLTTRTFNVRRRLGAWITVGLVVSYLAALEAATLETETQLDTGGSIDGAPSACGKCGKTTSKEAITEKYPKPVCGTDGNVYSSLCAMRRSACEQNLPIERQEWDKCLDKQSLCPDKCLDLYDPVCGEDNVLYLNYCVMQRKNCGKRVKAIDLVNCVSKARQARKLGCPEDCAPIYEPVCDSLGDVHYNECFFRKALCDDPTDDLNDANVKMLPLKTCVDLASSRCPEKCLPIMDPVCGSDGKRYLNHCKFAEENCKTNTKKMPWVYCLGEIDTIPTK